MNILAKSACDISQIKDRVNKGFNTLEIQLTSDFLSESRFTHNYSVIHSSKDWDIQNIHMPLSKTEEINLEYLGESNCSSVLFHACKLAQDCAIYYQHPVNIIIHCGESLSKLKLMPALLKNVEEILYLCTEYYPKVNFSIENLSPYYAKRGKVIFQPTAFAENVELAKYFNDKFKKERFFTTLDICHILMTQNMLNILEPESKISSNMYSLEWYFNANQHTINNIHMSNVRGLGLNKMHHGASFDESNPQDMELLENLLYLYKKYNYSCNVTLEVDELDYLNIVEAPKLKKIIEYRI